MDAEGVQCYGLNCVLPQYISESLTPQSVSESLTPQCTELAKKVIWVFPLDGTGKPERTFWPTQQFAQSHEVSQLALEPRQHDSRTIFSTISLNSVLETCLPF